MRLVENTAQTISNSSVAQVEKAIVWFEGQEPFETEIELFQNSDPIVRCEGNGLAEIYIHKNDSKYSLGTWIIKNKNCKRPSYLKFDEDAVPIEASALKRLHGLLQKEQAIRLELQDNDRTISLSISPLELSHASQFFITESKNKIENFETNKNYVCVLNLFEMTYCFKVFALEKEENKIIFALPNKVSRLLKRSLAREKKDLEVKVIEPEYLDVDLVNVSQLGICFQVKTSHKIKKWDVILVNLKESKLINKEINIKLKIVDVNENKIHGIFENKNLKNKFYIIDGNVDGSVYFKESPENFWKSLEDFGYIDLLDGDVLKKMKEECIEAWTKIQIREDSIQPVAFEGENPLGCIAAIKNRTNHWIPHSLAVKLDSSKIDVSSSLYQSWPSYILSENQPNKISTWYDANKKWHNRFYQVFILENEKSLELKTVVRHWTWCSEIILKEIKNQELQFLSLSDASADQNSQIDIHFKERYGKNYQKFPILDLNECEHSFFKELVHLVIFKNKIVGSIKFQIGNLEVNPFSVLNSAHIHIFDEEMKREDKIIFDIYSYILNYFLKNRIKRAGVTFDYNVNFDELLDDNTKYFCEARCLMTSSRLLSSLISNNSLNYADIRARKQSA